MDISLNFLNLIDVIFSTYIIPGKGGGTILIAKISGIPVPSNFIVQSILGYTIYPPRNYMSVAREPFVLLPSLTYKTSTFEH